MTSTDLQQDVGLGVHAVYQDQDYDVGLLGVYLREIETTWRSTVALAFLHTASDDDPRRQRLRLQRIIWSLKNRRTDEELRDHRLDYIQYAQMQARTRGVMLSPDSYETYSPSELERSPLPPSPDSLQLVVQRLRTESPMDLTLAVEGAGVSGLGIYALHLLARALRNPERVGSWLPRLLIGWHHGMQELEEAKQDRVAREIAEDAAAANMVAAAEIMTQLTPVEVTARGAGEPPEELRQIAGD